MKRLGSLRLADVLPDVRHAAVFLVGHLPDDLEHLLAGAVLPGVLLEILPLGGGNSMAFR